MKKRWLLIVILMTAFVWTSCEKSEEVEAASDTLNMGDDSSDFVDEQTWNTTINIIWDGTKVDISGTTDSVQISSLNGYVTINSSAKHIEYALSGNGEGQFSIYSSYKFKLSLEGLTLTCPDGPAINSQCKKTCYAVLGGVNTLSDGASYASTTEDRKAAFFSEGQICFSGSGSLAVTGSYKHAVASDDYIRVCEGTGIIDLTAKVSDGLHANDGIIINGGTITINAVEEGIQCDTSSVVITSGSLDITSTTDKGILAYANIAISGGTINITSKYKCIKTKSNLTISGGTITAVATGASSSGWGGNSSSGTPEGIEAKGTITITGGQVFAQASDDAINAGGEMTISGGYVMAYSTGNDGLDANGNCYIKGGTVYAIGASAPEVGIDANTEGGYRLYVEGGTIVAIGGLENNSSLSQSCYSASSVAEETWYALYNGNDVAFVFQTPKELSSSTFVVSTSGTTTLKSDVTINGGKAVLNGFALSDAEGSGGSDVSLSSYTGGNSGGGGPGGGGPGGGGPGGGGPGGGR